jgi:hypothetical protein
MPAKTEVDMFFKAPEKAKNAAANSAEVTERMVQQQYSVAEQVAASPPVPAETGSCIGSGMWIVGNIECKVKRKSSAESKASCGAQIS